MRSQTSYKASYNKINIPLTQIYHDFSFFSRAPCRYKTPNRWPDVAPRSKLLAFTTQLPEISLLSNNFNNNVLREHMGDMVKEMFF